MEFCYSCMTQLQTKVPVCPHCKSKIPYMPTHQEDLKPGSRLDNGRFIVGRALGHGGYGITYIAYDTKMLVKRTIKEYYPKGAVRNEQNELVYPQSEEAHISRTREHFLHEARMMIRASESHVPGVVQGIDTFNENGTSYILMEYLEGRTLDDHMHQVLYGPFPWQEAVRYTAEALASLQKLHEKNILHRDISCNNIFLCNDNTVRLIDFGSAEPLDKAQTNPGSLWRSRKPAYTPREQAENRKQGTYSDVYAMAVALFKMISGKTDPNLNGRPLPSVRAAANNQEIPAALDHILAEATAEDPEKRIRTAEEFRRKLLPLIGEKDRKKGRGSLIAILAALVALLGVAVFAIISGGKTADSWQGIGLETEERRITIPYGERFELSGSAEPGQEVNLFVLADGSSVEENIASATADSKGQWTLVYDTSESGVAQNEQKGYAAAVGYAESDRHTSRSDQIRLNIDRRLAGLTIGVKDNFGSNVLERNAGETITVYGAGQQGEPVTVTAQDDYDSVPVKSWEAEWHDGEWTCDINTAELEPQTGILSRKYRITACYEGYPDTQISRDNRVVLTVNRDLAPITLFFRDNGEKTIIASTAETIVTVCGTAEPGEELVLHVGDDTVGTVSVVAKKNGEWEIPLPELSKISGYKYDTRIELPVYARYKINPEAVSGKITLISNVRREQVPVIEKYPEDSINEGEDIRLSGIAEPGAVLEVRVYKAQKTKNLTPELTVTANEQTGEWEITFNTGDVEDERRERVTTYYTVSVCQIKGEKELVSQEMPLNVYYPVTYDPTSIRFADRNETEIPLDYREKVTLAGTAKPGEHMRLFVNDSAAQADIVADTDGKWEYTVSSLENWKPALDGKTELVLQIRYAAADAPAAEESLKVYVTNERFAQLKIGLDRDLIGLKDSAELTLEGAPGKEVDLVRNGYAWDTVTLDGSGRQTKELKADSLPSGANQAVFLAQYKDQEENRSEAVTLQVDRIAEPVQVTGNVTEETSRISGKAEPGAVLTLEIDGKKAGEQTVEKDGTFSFGDLILSAGSEIVINETDAYGNQASPWTTKVAAMPRQSIALEQFASGKYFTYGPKDCRLELSGTAAKNRTILVQMAGSEPTRVTAGEDEKWAAVLELPLQDKLQTTITLQYEDGRGGNIVLNAACDNDTDPPSVIPNEIYDRSPDTVACTVSEVNCTVRWQLKSADGKVKSESDENGIPVKDMKADIELPENREAGDLLTVTVSDPYGNEESVDIPVRELRDEIKGRIYSVLCGADEREITDGGTITGDLTVEAYAAAGKNTDTDKPVLKLIQNGNVISSKKLNQADESDEIERIAGKLKIGAGDADKYWRIKRGELSASGLSAGACELQMIVADKVTESWQLTYAVAEEGQQRKMKYEDTLEGYDAGMDEPAGSYSPRSIILTGWLYTFEDTERDITSGTLTLYEDRKCENKVCVIPSKQIRNESRHPGTTECGQEAAERCRNAYEDAGWILVFQNGTKIETGTYWAELEAGGFDFGLFEISIDNSAKQVRLNDFIKSLQWTTEE